MTLWFNLSSMREIEKTKRFFESFFNFGMK